LPFGAIDIAGGGRPGVWGPPAPTDVFLLLHGGVLAHVVVAGIDQDGVVHDAVHDGIGVNSGAEPLVPVFLAYWVQNTVDAPLAGSCHCHSAGTDLLKIGTG
jgi:hypothetical protein